MKQLWTSFRNFRSGQSLRLEEHLFPVECLQDIHLDADSDLEYATLRCITFHSRTNHSFWLPFYKHMEVPVVHQWKERDVTMIKLLSRNPQNASQASRDCSACSLVGCLAWHL